MGDFSFQILVWYRQNHRKLPWRNTKDPYKIWLSEVIMQQTRIDQGLSYYEKFIEEYPDIHQLAKAEEQEVLRLWQGLGYYSRARNLHFAAKQIANDFNGVFPDNYLDILSLKGVGTYTAAAIASFSFDLPYPVLDGNVFRVLSRYFNDYTPCDTGKGKKVFTAYAEALIDKENPSEFNQAIMELGALVCKPQNPDCGSCPLSDSCLAYRTGNFKELPFKSKTTKVSNRYFHYLILPSPKIQLEKRTNKGIWQNMFQFPMLETERKIFKTELKKLVKDKFNVKLVSLIFSEKHILTHQHIYATYWEIDKKIINKHLESTNLETIDKYPLPRLIERFIENHNDLFSL